MADCQTSPGNSNRRGKSQAVQAGGVDLHLNLRDAAGVDTRAHQDMNDAERNLHGLDGGLGYPGGRDGFHARKENFGGKLHGDGGGVEAVVPRVRADCAARIADFIYNDEAVIVDAIEIYVRDQEAIQPALRVLRKIYGGGERQDESATRYLMRRSNAWDENAS